MKNILLRQLIMLSKLTFYGIFLQCLFIGVLLASDLEAQKVKTVHDVYVTLDQKDIPIQDIFRKIESNSEFQFSYYLEDFDTKRKIRIDKKKMPVSEVLLQISQEAGVSFRQINNNINVRQKEQSFDGQSIQVVIAEAGVGISGKITSAEDGQGLPGVNVIVKGTSQGTITDIEGNYSLEVPNKESVLVFSSVGYAVQEVVVGNNTVIDLSLDFDVTKMDELVVVGYGKQKREDITTSISKLDDQVLKNVPYPNVGAALQGSMAGVRVQNTTGQPGAAPRIIVRGGTSINNPNGAGPLTIVDGVFRTMSNIAVEDIESIQVLKDAASTAIYGARASNGVVLITTKSGQKGKTKVNYSYDMTFSQQNRLNELASAEEYIRLARLGTVSVGQKRPNYLGRLNSPLGYGIGNDFTKNTDYTTMYLSDANRHKLNEGWQSMPDPVDPSQTIIFKETDFQALGIQTGVSKNHHISVSGGTDKSTFNAGVGYLDGQGTAKTTAFKRISLNLNGDLNVNKKLRFFARTLFAQSVDNRLASDSWLFWGAATRPTAKYAYEDGTLAPGRINQGNPDYHLNNREAENRTYNLSMSLGSKWDILPGLTFEPILAMNNTFRFDRSFQPSYGNGGGSLNSTRSSIAGDDRILETQADGILSYKKEFSSDHNLDAKVGLSFYKRSAYYLDATGQGASTDLIPTLNASSQFVKMSSTLSDKVILGYFSRVNYEFKNKYLFSLNMRYDGASNLGASNQWGFFPGVSVGWQMHREAFWDALPETFSSLKLRTSYGINGNISGLGDFTSQGTYSVGEQYAGGAVIRNTGIPNADLQWEKSKTLDIGADIGLVNNRFNLIFDYYRRVTDELLTTLSLPSSTGFTGILTNYGSLENKGVEIELNMQVMPATSDFQWQVSFNAAKVKSTILSLPENGNVNNRVGGYNVWDPSIGDYNWLGGTQEGGTMGDYYVYKQLGIYATDAEAQEAPYDHVSPTADKTKHGGDVIWQDSDNNGEIDARDRVYVGNRYPTLTGGISNYVSYKNFDFSLRLDYTTGHTVYNYGRAFYDINLDGDNVMTKRMAERSWKEQGDITDMPRYDWQDASEYNIRRGNSEYYESGNYLAVRELTLGYNLPANLLQKIKLNNVRINITGNNLHYFTKYKGMNPEDGGTEFGRYPIPRNIIFGIDISL
ncbi:MAG: TonB-dependent receptor [Cyclobacteriaceae bacterium]